jgi:hypothetical protein
MTSVPEKRPRVWLLLAAFALVSLVSVSARNWCYLCERIEGVEKSEIVEVANSHAVVTHVAEKMVGY